MTVRMHAHLSNYGFGYLFIYLFTYLFIYLLTHLFIYFIIYLYFIYLKFIWNNGRTCYLVGITRTVAQQ